MRKKIDYYLSLVSPWSYLGHRRFLEIAEDKTIPIFIYPIDFSIVFPSTGGVPLPQRSQQRQDYRMQELRRWREFLSLPLTLKPKFFPVNDELAATMVIALREHDMGKALKFAGACLLLFGWMTGTLAIGQHYWKLKKSKASMATAC